MRFIVFALILVSYLQTANGMNEFDELAHRIIDDIKSGDSISSALVEGWYDSDPPHVQSVIDAFKLPSEVEEKLQCMKELLEVLDENLSPVPHTKFHDLLKDISGTKRDGVVLLVFNYICGIPEY